MDNLGQEQMRPQVEDDFFEIDLREYIKIIWKGKWLLLGLVVAAVIAAYLISGLMTPIYQTSTLIMVKEDSGMDSLFSDQLSFMGGGQNKVATYTQILQSRKILGMVIEELQLMDDETGELIEPDRLKDTISVSGNQDSNLITITVTYPDPVVAKDIANTLVSEFQQENQSMNRADLRGASEFITGQLEEVRAKLTDVENRLMEYKEKHDVVLPDEQAKTILEKLVTLETNRAKAGMELQQAQSSLEELESNLLNEDREIISTKTISNNPVVMESKSRLASLQVELAGLKEVYTERHPKVIEVETKIDEVKEVLEQQVAEIVTARTETLNPIYQTLREKIINLNATIIGYQAQLATYDEQITDFRGQLVSLPEKELELARLERESRVAESIYMLLMERKEEIQIKEAMQSSDIAVVDPAVVNDNPIKPRKKLNVAIAAFLAIFIGLGIIFLLEYLDTTVKDEKDIERLTGLPVLGIIPDIEHIDHSRGYGRNDEDGD
ncbi:MAG: Wzz/FepE/Etk N-terminal domain-containing protein [Halanaerobium sp.]|nr:Wzz/FepE/Etk N-terminal domain-containing protein [Halanaerobium sp.]